MEKNKGLFSVRKYPVGDFPDEKKERKRKGGRLRQSMGFLLTAALIFNTLPASGLAVSASGRGLCEHHTEHTAECGYTEAQPCTHEHTEEKHSGEECYKTVTECVHTHTDECYPAMGETEESAGEGNATASDAEDREPESCTHVCSEESGCITKVLDCHHEHDESCGYTEAQECGYACEICNGTKPEDTENSKDANTDAAGCICETSCTEDNGNNSCRINGDCPVCGAEGADLSCCEGKETEESKKTGDTDINLCTHHKEHTAECGYSEEDNTPCGYECRICPIEDLIAALPDKVTIRNKFRFDNAEEVREQLDKILDLYRELTGEEQEQIDISRCLELQAALDEANAPVPLTIGDVMLSLTNREAIFTAGECGDNCQGHIITQNGEVQYVTILVESGTHNITFQDLNLTEPNVGVMPGATMNLTLGGNNTIKGYQAGIYVPKGATLVITAENAGSLDVSGRFGAGIGGAFYDPNGDDGDIDCGTVIINGGNITATGGVKSAGIGGAAGDPDGGNGGDITINGGTVTATGGSDGYYGGAGIGGGAASTPFDSAGSGGRLTINGGHVTLVPGEYKPENGIAYGFGKGSGNAPNGTCELTLADKSCLTVDSLDTKGKYTIKSAPTADMISVPEGMRYTSADMAAEIAEKVTLSGKVTICNQEFTVDISGWTLSVTKVSDMEYTATYIHADKGTISKTVTILPCIHNNGAALTHHKGREADCMQTGVMEHWECTVCGKKFSDAAGQTEITDTEIPTAHNLTHYAGKEADCTQTGVMEYWECTACGKKFSDKDGQTEVTDTEIPIAAHTLTHHAGKEADCTHTGTLEYWECSVCKKKFSAQDGKKEIADADIVISVKPHTLIHHAKVEEGCLTEGSIEYWSCDVCHKLFDDASGTKEVNDIKIPAAGHKYSEWKSNNNGTHTRSCQTSGCDFTETGNCSGGTATYTEKAKCEVCGGEYGEQLTDTGAPTGEISIKTNRWNSFLHTITFGLFFKKTEQVTITAQDNESGVASVSYYISDSKLTEEEVKKLDNWTAGNTDKTTFNISQDKSCVIYAKITDKQGNVTYISSDGLVFDGTPPSITGITSGETYCISQEVAVTDNNPEPVTVTVNGKEQTLSDGEFTLDVEFDTAAIVIAAEDKAGNVTTVTVYAGHNYGTDWKSASSGHWQECYVCGDMSNSGTHTEDSGTVTKPATETETGIRIYNCSVCGYAVVRQIRCTSSMQIRCA